MDIVAAFIIGWLFGTVPMVIWVRTGVVRRVQRNGHWRVEVN